VTPPLGRPAHVGIGIDETRRREHTDGEPTAPDAAVRTFVILARDLQIGANAAAC
jgi:hypothetical protein